MESKFSDGVPNSLSDLKSADSHASFKLGDCFVLCGDYYCGAFIMDRIYAQIKRQHPKVTVYPFGDNSIDRKVFEEYTGSKYMLSTSYFDRLPPKNTKAEHTMILFTASVNKTVRSTKILIHYLKKTKKVGATIVVIDHPYDTRKGSMYNHKEFKQLFNKLIICDSAAHTLNTTSYIHKRWKTPFTVSDDLTVVRKQALANGDVTIIDLLNKAYYLEKKLIPYEGCIFDDVKGTVKLHKHCRYSQGDKIHISGQMNSGKRTAIINSIVPSLNVPRKNVWVLYDGVDATKVATYQSICNREQMLQKDKWTKFYTEISKNQGTPPTRGDHIVVILEVNSLDPKVYGYILNYILYQCNCTLIMVSNCDLLQRVQQSRLNYSVIFPNSTDFIRRVCTEYKLFSDADTFKKIVEQVSPNYGHVVVDHVNRTLMWDKTKVEVVKEGYITSPDHKCTQSDILKKYTGSNKVLLNYYPESFKTQRSYLLIGKRMGGKTATIINRIYRDICNEIQDLYIVCPTDKYSNQYAPICNRVFSSVEDMPKILKNLKNRAELCKQNGEYLPKSLIILDDCLASKGIKDPWFIDLLLNHMHYGITIVVSMQFPLGLTPDVRCNFDTVILHRDDLLSNQKRLYEHYAGMFPTFNAFQNMFDHNTQHYHSMVILGSRTTTNNIFQKVYRIKPTLHTQHIKFVYVNYKPKEDKRINLDKWFGDDSISIDTQDAESIDTSNTINTLQSADLTDIPKLTKHGDKAKYRTLLFRVNKTIDELISIRNELKKLA